MSDHGLAMERLALGHSYMDDEGNKYCMVCKEKTGTYQSQVEHYVREHYKDYLRDRQISEFISRNFEGWSFQPIWQLYYQLLVEMEVERY